MQKIKICIEVDSKTLIALGAASEINKTSIDNYIVSLIQKDLMVGQS
jgi:hypothetical protein